MTPLIERGVLACIFLLALNALGFSIASIVVNEEKRPVIVNYGIGIGILLITLLFVFFILGLLEKSSKED